MAAALPRRDKAETTSVILCVIKHTSRSLRHLLWIMNETKSMVPCRHKSWIYLYNAKPEKPCELLMTFIFHQCPYSLKAAAPPYLLPQVMQASSAKSPRLQLSH